MGTNKKFKKCLALVLAVAMVFSMVVPGVTVYGNLTVSDEVTLRDAVLNAGTVPTTITLTTNISLTNGTLNIPTGADITIDGGSSSNKLIADGDFDVITIASGASLTISNITITRENGTTGRGINVSGYFIMTSGEISGHTVTIGVSGGGVYIKNGGTFTMKSGIIRGNEADNGGGVGIFGGKFTMYDGTIGSNKAIGTVGGGGVHVTDANGEFIMRGGTIGGNANSGNEATRGGGVFVGFQSKFTMYSGTISYNESTEDTGWGGGGGVNVGNSGTFIMNGGVISSNIAAQDGGGVSLDWDAKFNMYNGTIGGANNRNTAARDGGGVFVDFLGEFTMVNGTISHNEAVEFGGGVNIGIGGTFNMGDGIINDNRATGGGGGVYVGFIQDDTDFGGGTPPPPPNEDLSRFTMTGGTIINNDSTRGGGVKVDFNGIFNMSLGTIGSTANGNTATWGGGVYYRPVSPNTSNNGGVFNLIANNTVVLHNIATNRTQGNNIFPLHNNTVTFNPQGGTHISGGLLAQDIPHGDYIISFPTVAFSGFVFDGWFDAPSGGAAIPLSALTLITAPRTLFAQWTPAGAPVTHTVTFNLNGGTHTGGGALTQTVPSGGDATLPIVTRSGYTFAGWSPAGAYNNVAGDITITAQWTVIPPVTWTVTFNLAGGNINGDTANIVRTNIPNGGNATPPPDPTRSGYTFAGWLGTYTNVTGNRTITAQWTQIPAGGGWFPPIIRFNIIYHPNGGAGATITDRVVHGRSHTVRPTDTFTRDNYIFTGWNTRPDGSGTTHEPGSVIQNMTSQLRLYAQWGIVVIKNDVTTTAELAPDGFTVIFNAADLAYYRDDTGEYIIEIPGRSPIIGIYLPLPALGGDGLTLITDFGTVHISDEVQQVKTGSTESNTLRMLFQIPSGSATAGLAGFRVALLNAAGNEIPYHDPENPLFIRIPVTLETDTASGYVPALRSAAGNVIMPFSVYYYGDIVFKTPTTGTFDVIYNTLVFADVERHWSASYIDFVSARRLFIGTGDNLFIPTSTMTRGHFVQVLANLEGVDLSAYRGISRFTDVSVYAWYAPAVEWAANAGLAVVYGYDDGYFGPSDSITREQMAVMLANYIRFKDFVLPGGQPIAFNDEAGISAWAREGVRKIQAAGIIVGRPGNIYVPQATATRAEVTAIFARFIEVYIRYTLGLG